MSYISIGEFGLDFFLIAYLLTYAFLKPNFFLTTTILLPTFSKKLI